MMQELLTYLSISAAVGWTFFNVYETLFAKKKTKTCSSSCKQCEMKKELFKKLNS